MVLRPSSASLWTWRDSSLRRSSVRDGIGIRITLPSLDGFKPEIGDADGAFERREQRGIERLRHDQRGLGNRQRRDLIHRHLRSVRLDVHMVEKGGRRAARPDAGELVFDVVERDGHALGDFGKQSFEIVTSICLLCRVDKRSDRLRP